MRISTALGATMIAGAPEPRPAGAADWGRQAPLRDTQQATGRMRRRARLRGPRRHSSSAGEQTVRAPAA
jgi:hypothetical protein